MYFAQQSIYAEKRQIQYVRWEDAINGVKKMIRENAPAGIRQDIEGVLESWHPSSMISDTMYLHWERAYGVDASIDLRFVENKEVTDREGGVWTLFDLELTFGGCAAKRSLASELSVLALRREVAEFGAIIQSSFIYPVGRKKE